MLTWHERECPCEREQELIFLLSRYAAIMLAELLGIEAASQHAIKERSLRKVHKRFDSMSASKTFLPNSGLKSCYGFLNTKELGATKSK